MIELVLPVPASYVLPIIQFSEVWILELALREWGKTYCLPLKKGGGIGYEKSHMLLLHLVTTNSMRKVCINFADFWQVNIYKSHNFRMRTILVYHEFMTTDQSLVKKFLNL